MSFEEERHHLSLCNTTYTAMEKHRKGGDPLTDLEVASAALICAELAFTLSRLGPRYEMVTTDLSLKAQEFQRIQRVRDLDSAMATRSFTDDDAQEN